MSLSNLFGKNKSVKYLDVNQLEDSGINQLEHVKINQRDSEFLTRENRWDLWIRSPQYAKAFKAYWNNKGFPLEIYPTWLLSSSINGTLRYEQLEGEHIWIQDSYDDFVKTRIYNEQLHVWVHRLMYEHFVDVAVKTDNFVKRERWYYPNRKGFYVKPLNHKITPHRHQSHHKHHTHYSAWETLSYRLRKSWKNIYFKSAIFLFAFCLTLLFLINDCLHPLYAASIFIGLTVAGLLFYKGVPAKLFWVTALFVALAYLIYVLNPLAFMAISVLLGFGALFLIIFIIDNILIFIRNTAWAGGLGFGGVGGGTSGFFLAKKLFGKKKN